MQLSKNKLREIAALKQRKTREEQQLFTVEGEKLAQEILQSDWKINCICALPEWISKNELLLKKTTDIYEITEDQLHKISNLATPNKILIVAVMPSKQKNETPPDNELSLFLDGIQDPGNLGTIIRLADWFGIGTIACTPDTVEVYNPKVIQSTMGAFLRIKTIYVDPKEWLHNAKKLNLNIFGTFLGGTNLYQENLPAKGIIIMGNESKGISKEMEVLTDKKITIPSFPPERQGSESLNVAIAASIVCAEFRRQNSIK